MALKTELVADLSSGPHEFTCLALDGDSGWEHMAGREYACLCTATRFPVEPLSLEGIGVVDTQRIQDLLQGALVPVRVGGNFDVVRSDLGEVLGVMFLRERYETQFAYLSVRDRELRQLPGRGIDAIGVEAADGLQLILAEIKVSDEEGRTPQVVDVRDDSLRAQLVGHIRDHEATTRKIWDIARRAGSPELQRLFTAAALYWQERAWGHLDVVCCAILVRPRAKYDDRDFGSLRDDPSQVDPARVRFVVLCVPGELEAAVTTFHGAATTGEAQG